MIPDTRNGADEPHRSLAAAVIRLIVQWQISNGGYAAHTDVDRKPAITRKAASLK